MKVKEGIYVGASCTLIVEENILRIAVSDEQLDLLRKFKNYEFHFNQKGEHTGTGTTTTAMGSNEGEIRDKSLTEEELT